MERIEDIPNFARIEFIKDLAEDEGIENYCEMVRGTINTSENCGSFLQQKYEQGQLIGGLDKDISPHRTANKASIALIRATVQE
mmetsp:Transcript_16371/g.22456  ORF Transcript_16371/g.22456 Transcript_16371/m.22456 type:complete len:84 (-) Transcript_16371:795-1046(-)